MKRLFGTDGIRGIAGKYPLKSAEVHRLGMAAGQVLRKKYGSKKCRIIAVRDTRLSGAILSKSLFRGFRETGVDVFDVGILSTPSVAFLVRAHRFDSGVVVSASHNPPEFNGIKFFNNQGRKWPDAWERSVERGFFSMHRPTYFPKGAYIRADSLIKDYENFLVDTLHPSVDFSSFRLALDCSHGANSALAPSVFKRLGADVRVMGDRPTGKNINVGCGSQNTRRLRELVFRERCDAGIAFDGDGDRVIFLDEKGSAIDGDHIIAILASDLKNKGILKNNMVITTVMANLGLKKFLKRRKIRSIDVAVGDRYVSEAMKKTKAVLGGEQSGHIILGKYLPTGDGLLTALHVVAAAHDRNEPFSKLARWMKKYPQVFINVRVKERIPLDKLNGVQKKIDRVQNILGDNGRVLVRYSGTEPLLRIMLEGPDKKKLNSYSNEIASEVKKAGNYL